MNHGSNGHERGSSATASRVSFGLDSIGNWGLLVPPTVYPPREDTHLLAEALASIREHSGIAVEIGCGSGAISIVLASQGWNVVACDVNPLAVAATRGNARSAGLSDSITVTEGGVGEHGWRLPERADLIVWNLPYLEPEIEGESLEPIEDASMLDIPGGWSDKLLQIITDSKVSDDCIVVMLHRTDPPSQSKPESWLKAGWASRTLGALRLGEERLEAICYWRPASGSDPIVLEECDSTMDEARSLDSSVWGRLLSMNQTSGRGRRGTIWETKLGGLACTWVMPMSGLDDLEPGLLQTSIGSSVSLALGCHCKWPNDLIDKDGAKLGGILVESSTSELAVRVGIGINRVPSIVDGVGVTGWKGTDARLEFSEVFALVDSSLASLFEHHRKVPSTRKEDLVGISWRGLANSLSRGVLIEAGKGDARAVGIDSRGRLEIESSGEVRVTDEVGSLDWIIPTE
ncbi:MAG: methyltransferase [Candidatus Thalassarchaeum sp.]